MQARKERFLMILMVYDRLFCHFIIKGLFYVPAVFHAIKNMKKDKLLQ